MSIKSYDSIPENADILLDLPFAEGVGIETHDVAKSHHPVSLVNTPTWGTSPSGISILDLDESSSEYAEIDAADSTDLDFTTGDYSFGLWYNSLVTAEVSQLLAGKYVVNVGGWEIYTTKADPLRYLSLRHHHAGGAGTRSSAFSLGWEFSTWWFLGISRSGSACQMYRNGEPVETTSELEDPETAAASDIVIGARYTKDANFFNGSMYGLRMWPREVVESEWKNMFDRERDFFDV